LILLVFFLRVRGLGPSRRAIFYLFMVLVALLDLLVLDELEYGEFVSNRLTRNYYFIFSYLSGYNLVPRG